MRPQSVRLQPPVAGSVTRPDNAPRFAATHRWARLYWRSDDGGGNNEGNVVRSRDYRIAGEIALKSSQPDTAKAQGYFERALAIARSSKQNPGNCAPR